MPVKKTTKRKVERRERPRADASLSMRVESQEEVHSQIVTETQNISASGIYCRSPHYLAPMSKVALTIVLPRLPGHSHAQELVKCEGIVVRCTSDAKRTHHPFQLACMFTGLDTKRRALLEDFVAWRNLQALRAAAGIGTARRPAKAAGASSKASRAKAKRTTTARATTKRATAKRAAPKRAAAKRTTTGRRKTARARSRSTSR